MTHLPSGVLAHTEFIEQASLLAAQPGTWCCLVTDIQHFKIFNSWHGQEKADQLLSTIGSVLARAAEDFPAVVSYFGHDNYAIFMPHYPNHIKMLYNVIKDVVSSYGNTLGFLPAFGIYILENTDNFGTEIYDRAFLAVEDAKKGYENRICYFDSKKFLRLTEEMQLAADFHKALKNGEICFYLQPQCSITNDRILGAEALVRWIRPDGTIISPTAFLPFMEKHGFITDLDKYIWESVCLYLRGLMDRGITPVPISINVSQIDIMALDVASYLYGLIQRINIPARFLKVEITESSFASDFDTISAAVTALRSKGFCVLLDDFGSGYSSLNMLDKINTDVLKLDMAFLKKDSGMNFRGISIIDSIISMTKTLSIPVIFEGVETEEQLEFLRNLGVMYAQGYYFYRPMPVDAFEMLIRDPAKVDYAGFVTRPTELFRSREFLDESTFPDTVLNNILGPVAFYTQTKDGALNITRFNQPFFDCIADVNMEQRTNTIQNYVFPEDHPRMDRMLETAVANPASGGECTIRFFKSGGGEFWYNMHLYFLKESEQGKIFYGKIADATKMYRQADVLFSRLKSNAYSAMRIDLQENLFYEIGSGQAFDDPTARSLDVVECLRRTAEMHIPDPEERKAFVEFFHPERLKKSHAAGIYNEEIPVHFIIRGKIRRCRFSAFYIKFVPDQNDNVYIFVYPEG